MTPVNLNLADSNFRKLMVELFNKGLAATLRTLIETKHLYQRASFTFSISDLDPQLQTGIGAIRYEPQMATFLNKLNSQAWYIGTEQFAQQIVGTKEYEFFPSIVVQNVKLFCRRCNSAEVHRPVAQFEIKEVKTASNHPPLDFAPIDSSPQIQFFALRLDCQRCTTSSSSFLIHRSGSHLSIHGRSPMEHLELPRFIPKTEEKFYRDALIASHSGKTLAGLFYLRTFIEQFARRLTGKSGERATGDEIMTAYTEMLPQSLRGQMPSLRECYEKLSVPIHSGVEDEGLFEKMRSEIEWHFELRKANRIQDQPPAISEPPAPPPSSDLPATRSESDPPQTR